MNEAIESSKLHDRNFSSSVFILLSLSRGAKSRTKILFALLPYPKNCNQIAREVELDWWTIQKHLRYLTDEKLIESYNFGKCKFYELTIKGQRALDSVQAKKD
jgi:predicted transcriptional regulator